MLAGYNSPKLFRTEANGDVPLDGVDWIDDWIDYNVARVADALNLLYRIGMSQTVLTHRLFLLKLLICNIWFIR